MNIPDKTGHSNRANMEFNRDQILRRFELGLQRPPDEAELDNLETQLSGPPFSELAYLYYWFSSISAGRSSNGFGPNSLSATEILAWSQMTGHRLTPWEFDLIRELDGLWLSIYSELHKPDPPKKRTID
jgi:hypothetical protein